MTEKIRITVLVENTVNQRGLKAEHGLACLIEIGGARVLFDTGQTALLLDNAKALGCSLESLDAIVLSHGHYDHTGGLAAVCNLSPTAQVFLHPAALEAKFSANADGSALFVGMPQASKQAVANAGPKLILTPTCREVAANLFVTGEIPHQTDFEDVGGRFFLDERCQQPDPLADDQALFFQTPEGVVVLLGCAHAGVVNTLIHIKRLTVGKRIHAVLGGMHLGSASPDRMEKTIAHLRQESPNCLRPAHCTGISATARLWTEFPGRCSNAPVGTTLSFPR